MAMVNMTLVLPISASRLNRRCEREYWIDWAQQARRDLLRIASAIRAREIVCQRCAENRRS